MVKSLLPTLMTQARFRTDDLVKALDPNNYSRYLIAPHREDAATKMDARFRIACGALGGFGGFLDQSFRAHDYQLGRRNCQQFLRKTFGLPVGAAAVDDKAEDQRIAAKASGPEHVRVIPLIGDAKPGGGSAALADDVGAGSGTALGPDRAADRDAAADPAEVANQEPAAAVHRGGGAAVR